MTKWAPPCGCVVEHDDKNTEIVYSFKPCTVHKNVTKESAHKTLQQWCIRDQKIRAVMFYVDKFESLKQRLLDYVSQVKKISEHPIISGVIATVIGGIILLVIT